VRFKSNHDLSVQRAQSVADVLAPHLSDPDRLVVEGRGPDDPIASNQTAEGRAQNRRVDILLPRTDCGADHEMATYPTLSCPHLMRASMITAGTDPGTAGDHGLPGRARQ
jgi:hypothetical protein